MQHFTNDEINTKIKVAVLALPEKKG